MVAIIDSFIAGAGPYLEQAWITIWLVLRLIGILAVIGYGILIYKFDIKINVREYSKGGRIINYSTRAIRMRDKRTGAPKIRLFGRMGFGGDKINEPPAECLIANRSKITYKMYDLIKKDGLYYPVNNFVLGVKVQYKDEKTGEIKETYTTEGSGLEVNRDYDAEQAIQNTLIEKATSYRNRKPTGVIASFALMIITIIVAGIITAYLVKQIGALAPAIASLREPLKEGIMGAAQGIIGPG